MYQHFKSILWSDAAFPRSVHQCRIRPSSLLIVFVLIVPAQAEDQASVHEVLQRVHHHEFYPLNEEGTFTIDRDLKKHGVADLNNQDWRVRLLAIRDLVHALPDAAEQIEQGLFEDDLHVRHVAAASLGIARVTTASDKLERVLRSDKSPLVRCQAAKSLGQIESNTSLELLKTRMKDDPSRDVRHQCELAVGQIQRRMGATEKLKNAFQSLDPNEFGRVKAGDRAPEFALDNTSGGRWTLRRENEKGWVVLIWIFADWCPVCHSEFRELIDMQKQFEKVGVQVATIECHDTFRGRVMIGQELDPQYWFTKKSHNKDYESGVWWPHLLDRAGAVGSKYGVDPKCFAVHGEYINRPSTVIIDPEGVVRFAYFGTFWGDRPTIHQTLEMIETTNFNFKHPKRRELN